MNDPSASLDSAVPIRRCMPERRRPRPVMLAAALCLLSGLFVLPGIRSAAAQAVPPGATVASQPDGSKEDDEAKDGLKITLNGYLSQAYAISDGNQVSGIPKQGTADYRTAAVQMRVDMTPQDTFSVKLRHERIGESPFQAFQPDVALDWIFYEHKFGDSAVKVGRVKIPFGLFNEVRDVGTLLPFYRAPTDFYGAGSFTTQTIDGALVNHAFNLGGGWRLDGDLYYGNWEFVASESEGVFKSKARNSLGAEMWLETPLPGLRIGVGGMTYTVVKEEAGGTVTTPSKSYHVSVEERLGRLVTHVEYKYRHTADAKINSGYVHLGFLLTDRLTVNGQAERYHTVIAELPDGKDQDDDRALGLNYAFRTDLVLKLEHHWNRGFNTEVPASGLFGPRQKTRYGILSLSTSF
jgi:hypothetical protein